MRLSSIMLLASDITFEIASHLRGGATTDGVGAINGVATNCIAAAKALRAVSRAASTLSLTYIVDNIGGAIVCWKDLRPDAIIWAVQLRDLTARAETARVITEYTAWRSAITNVITANIDLLLARPSLIFNGAWMDNLLHDARKLGTRDHVLTCRTANMGIIGHQHLTPPFGRTVYIDPPSLEMYTPSRLNMTLTMFDYASSYPTSMRSNVCDGMVWAPDFDGDTIMSFAGERVGMVKQLAVLAVSAVRAPADMGGPVIIRPDAPVISPDNARFELEVTPPRRKFRQPNARERVQRDRPQRITRITQPRR